jgi:hypothetical protein
MHLSYLGLGFLLSLIWIIMYLKRFDLRMRLVKSGLIGILGSIISEYFFKSDYWHPISVLGNYNTVIEDLFVGFSLCGVSTCCYNYFCNVKCEKKTDVVYRHTFFYSLSGFGLFLLFHKVFANSSMESLILSFIIFFLYSIFLNKGNFKRGLINAIIFSALLLCCYLILFILIYPDFWNSTLREPDKISLIKIMNGSFPHIELLWYAGWGLIANVYYDVIGGYNYNDTRLTNSKLVGFKRS